MTREHQLERFLFSVKTANNGQASLTRQTILDGLSHALTSTNMAVAYEAAALLSDQLREDAR